MNETKNTLLHLVVVHGHSQVVSALLRYGRSNPDLNNKLVLAAYKITSEVEKNCEGMTLSLCYLRTTLKVGVGIVRFGLNRNLTLLIKIRIETSHY